MLVFFFSPFGRVPVPYHTMSKNTDLGTHLLWTLNSVIVQLYGNIYGPEYNAVRTFDT